MAGLLRLANTSTGRTTVTPSASADVTVTLPDNGGTLLTNNYNGPDLTINAQVDITGAGNGLTVDGNVLVVDVNNNRVGIGTNTPQAKLDVNDVVQARGFNAVNPFDNSQARPASIDYKFEGLIGASVRAERPSGGNINDVFLRFETGGILTPKMVIASNGNVGIGTDNPQVRLDVEGPAVEYKATNTTAISGTAGNQQIFKFDVRGQKNGQYRSAGSIIFRQDSTTWSALNNSNGPTRIEFCTQNSDNSDSSEIPRLVVDSEGNVGIGTNNPTDKLVITDSGSASINIKCGNNTGTSNLFFGDSDVTYTGSLNYDHTDDALLFKVGGTTSEKMRIASNGNVGIGTTNPQARLDVRTSSDGEIARFVRGDDTNIPILAIKAQEADGQLELQATGANSSKLGFDVGGNIRMQILPNGNVGIGTTNPQAKLDVNGDLKCGGTLIFTGATKGIKFGDGSPTVTTKTLDDYEEGTWTPAYVGGGAGSTDPTITYDNSNTGGTYTKIGNLVTATATISMDGSVTAGTGRADLGGLPYAVSTSNVGRSSFAVAWRNGWTSSGQTPEAGLANGGQSQCSLYYYGNNGNIQTFSQTDLEDSPNGGLRITLSYFTDA